jgi:hypothetical protein
MAIKPAMIPDIEYGKVPTDMVPSSADDAAARPVPGRETHEDHRHPDDQD